MLNLLIMLWIVLVVAYVVYLVVGYLSLPEPIQRAVYIIVGLIILLWLLRTLGVV